MNLSRINLRQPKYVIPLFAYAGLLWCGFMVNELMDTEVEEADNGLETTQYINDNLPQTNIKGDGIGNRYDNMKRSFGKIQDLSAVDNIDRDDEIVYEDFRTQYSEEERRQLEQDAQQRSEELDHLREMQDAINDSAVKGAGMVDGQEVEPVSEETRLVRAQSRQDAAMEELNRALAEARLGGRRAVQQTVDTITDASVAVVTHETPAKAVDSGAVRSIDDEAAASDVIKVNRESSDFFNTIAENEPSPNLIKAIIDEDITATDGSRVRLRLLDDVQINDVVLHKGAYIYATMSGFGSQRVKGTVQSILVSDELFKVNLSLYDTDGLEGLYVPASKFRETAKNVGSGAMSGSMSMSSSGSGNDMVKTWGLNALNNAYQKTTNAISNAIKQNKAKLKYGTQVYLVNGREKRDK